MHKLTQLWQKIEELNRQHFPDNRLQAILGGGCAEKPEVMFVFINPTARNISSSSSWKGPRTPFLGTAQVWKIFADAGWFDRALSEEIRQRTKNKSWDVPFAERVIAELRQRKIWFTNIVKWTGTDAALPDAEKIKLFIPYFLEEIKIIQPKRIVTFGLIPFEALTGTKIKLGNYYTRFMNGERSYFSVQGIVRTTTGTTDRAEIPVLPCYFPVGRGNPKRATALLKVLAHECH